MVQLPPSGPAVVAAQVLRYLHRVRQRVRGCGAHFELMQAIELA